MEKRAKITLKQLQNLRGASGPGKPITYRYVPGKGTESGIFEELGQGQEFLAGEILVAREEDRIRMIEVEKANVPDGIDVSNGLSAPFRVGMLHEHPIFASWVSFVPTGGWYWLPGQTRAVAGMSHTA